MIDGFKKEDPPSIKKLPVEVDLPEEVARQEFVSGVSNKAIAVGQLVLIAFYFLLRVGEYTTKSTRNDSKQTQQFSMKDVTFFKRDWLGRLKQLPRNSPDAELMSADGVTLKLGNQKNGWKGVCLHHHPNGDPILCPVRTVGRLYCRIRRYPFTNGDTWLSAYMDEKGDRQDVSDKDVRQALKIAGTTLNYPELKGIPIDRIDTHSLRGGGANALSLAGYSDLQIQKMGRWRGETFKEYVSEQLSSFSEGMSTSMSTTFGFVNVEGGVWSDVTAATITLAYDPPAAASA
jgi:hypothetical protein